ncbi:MAG: recombinase family protein [Oscillospiraceae bacterium]|nr:recombinase family protein [Oscillospiraceae bacterium]
MARIRKAQNREEKARQIQWLTAIYIRLSREDGNDESFSVTNQRQRLAAYFESVREEESMQLAGFYIDDGFTGIDSDRDAFQRMLRDLDEGKVNCIIVKDLSRLSRNDWECKRYLQHLFVIKDVRFISLELPRLDSYKRPDDIYDLGVTMQSAYNENHCRETSIKIRGTLNAKRRAGQFIGAFAPYGFLKDPADKHKLIPDPETAPIVQDIFHWYVREGMNKSRIMRQLIELDIPCPTAYKRQCGMKYYNPKATVGEPIWTVMGVLSILQNQMYLGHMVQGKQKVKSYKVHTRVNLPEEDWIICRDTHEPLIDQELFEKAQEIMLRDSRTAPDQKRVYPFSGFLRCAECEKAMCRRPSKNNVYYACRTYSTTKLCSSHSIRHDRLEAIVVKAIQTQVDLIDNLADVIDSINAAPVVRVESKRLEIAQKQKRQELEKATLLRSSLYADWKNGDITRDEYHAMKRQFEQREENLRGELDRLEEKSRVVARGVDSANPYFDTFRKHRGLTSLDRGIVADLIQKICVQEGGGVDIDFTFAAEHQRALEFIESNRDIEMSA